jgi:hypothetical protein
MPFSVNGIGTTYYGCRDFLPNGSYITTEWVIVLFIPVVPLSSFRVLPIGGRKPGLLSSSQQYSVQRVPLCVKQVRNTYLAVLIGILAVLPIYLLGTNTTISSIYGAALLITVLIWFAVSRWLRRRKRRSVSAHSSQAASKTISEGIADKKNSKPSNYSSTQCLEVHVTEGQLQRQETISIQPSFHTSTFSLQLKPEMRNKKVRLREALGKETGHLFVYIHVLSDDVYQQASQASGPQPRTATASSSYQLNKLKTNLLQLIHNDEKTCVRLVNYERSRNPHKSEEELYQDAIDRLLRDRR